MAEHVAGPQQIGGRWLKCPVCDGDQFWTRRTLMNTKKAAIFDLEWMGKAADNYICDRCGYVFWFLSK